MKKVCFFLAVILIVLVAAGVLLPGIPADIYEDLRSTFAAQKYAQVQVYGVMEIEGYLDVKAFSEGFAPVKTARGWGFVDRLGNLTVDTVWDEADGFSDGLARVKRAGHYGYVDGNGNAVIAPRWAEGSAFSEGYAWVAEENAASGRKEYYIIDKQGNLTAVDSSCIEICGRFSEGLVPARNQKDYGYLNTKGQFEIAPEYDDAKEFCNGLAAVKTWKKWGYINRKGKTAAAINLSRASSFNDEGVAAVQIEEDSAYKYIGKSGIAKFDLKWNVDPKILGEPKSFDEFFRYVKEWNRMKDMDVEPVGYSEGLALVRAEDGSMGFMNRNGKLVIDPYEKDFDEPYLRWSEFDLFSSGLAMATTRNGRGHGYINRNGQLVCSPMWETATRFSEGIAIARANGRTYILYSDEVANGIVEELFSAEAYDRLGSLGKNGVSWCLEWEAYNGNYTLGMREFYMDIAQRLMMNKAYLPASWIYAELNEQEKCMNAYLAHAQALLLAGKHDEARRIVQRGLQSLPEIGKEMNKRAQEKLLEIDYAAADALAQQKAYVAAAEAFAALHGYADADNRRLEMYYLYGMELMQSGQTEEAMIQLVKAEDYADAREQVEAYYLPEFKAKLSQGRYREAARDLLKPGIPEFTREAYRLRSDYLMDDRIAWDVYDGKEVIVLSAAGKAYINDINASRKTNLVLAEEQLTAVGICSGTEFGLRADGTVVSAYYQFDTSSWTDVVAIATGERHLIGLRADGTVLATGSDQHGQLDVGEWSDVVEIAGDYTATYGLRRDGTVLMTKAGEKAVSARNGWKDIVDIAAGTNVVGLRADGKVLVAVGKSCEVFRAPEGTVAVAELSGEAICLLEDGTAVSLNGKPDSKALLKTYKDIAAIAGGSIYIDHEGMIMPEKTAGTLLNEERSPEERFVPPAMTAFPREEWLEHAKMLIDSGAYRAAVNLLRHRQEDEEAAELYQQAVYAQADHLKQTGDLEGASQAYSMIEDGEETVLLEQQMYYEEAKKLLEQGDLKEAEAYFKQAGDYEDARQLLESIAGEHRQEELQAVEALREKGRELEALYMLRRIGDAGSLKEAYRGLYAYDRRRPKLETKLNRQTWTLSANGTIQVADDVRESHPEFESMSGFVASSGTHRAVVGLTGDGEVYVPRSNGNWERLWSDIVAIDSDGFSTVGLKSDGTVAAVWWEDLSAYYQLTDEDLDLSGWTDIVAVEVQSDYAVGLKKDGTVVTKGRQGAKTDVSGWTDIVDISCGRDVTVGLKSDGTVVAAGSDTQMIKEIQKWKDIVEIAALSGPNSVVGVRRDGKLVEAE